MNSTVVSGTMRFTDTIIGHPVKILLVGESDDSFIQPRIAHFLNLEIQPTTAFKVLMGNGQTLEVAGCINELPIKVQGYSLKILVFSYPLQDLNYSRSSLASYPWCSHGGL